MTPAFQRRHTWCLEDARHRVQIGSQIVISCDLGRDDPERPGFPQLPPTRSRSWRVSRCRKSPPTTTCSGPPGRPSRSWSTATTSARSAGARPGRPPDAGPVPGLDPVRVPELPHPAVAPARRAGRRGGRGRRRPGQVLGDVRAPAAALVQPRPRLPAVPRPGPGPGHRPVPAGGHRPCLRRQDRGRRAGRASGTASTHPKFYVDGERIDGKFPLEGLEDAIRASIRAAGADQS